MIPNYNGKDLLAECLPSVVREIESYGRGSEVIVVDDASSDGSAAWLKQNFPSVRVVELKANRGFGEASDRGIRAAESDLVLLLNSDISASEGFLGPLVEALGEPGVFGVQPRADYPQGGLNFGLNMGRLERGYPRFWNESDTAASKHVDFLCPTLYCLGGAMLFDRRQYFFLGGFDPLYRPFRWEDIDLCYRAAKRGWKVLYQPGSLVTHKHHATLNRVFSARYRNVVETRNELLFAWKNLTEPGLIEEHFRNLPGILLGHLLAGRANFAFALAGALPHLFRILPRRRRERASSRRRDRQVMNLPRRKRRNFLRGALPGGRRQVLALNPVFPYPPVDGGKQRVFHVLKALALNNDVHLLCFLEPGREADLEGMKGFCASITTVPWPPPEYGNLGPVGEALFPMYYRHYWSPEMVRSLREILREKPIDLVQMESDKMLYYVVDSSALPTVFVEQDAANLYFTGGKNPPQRGPKRLLDVFEWLRAVRWEAVMGRKYWKVLALSPEDERSLRRLLPGADIGSVKHGTCVDEYYAAYREVEKPSLIYIGSFCHYPNLDAVSYLIREVWPRVRERFPGAVLTVVGSHPTPEILALNGREGIEVAGFVSSVLPYLDAASVFVAPMRKGLGMKGKILEAMARGKPVVTTSIGIRGAEVEPGKHLLVGDSPEEFAESVIRLLEDRSFRREVAEAGQELARREYDWSCSAAQLEKIYAELLEETP